LKGSILITGPTSGLEHYAEAARGAGWEPILAPLLRIEQLDVKLEQGLAAEPDWICVTSSNALFSLEACAQRWSRVPCAAMGQNTSGRLRELGFRVEIEGARTGAELASSLLPRLAPGAHVLWPRGELATELASILREHGAEVSAPVVYRTLEREDHDPLPAADAAFLASPSTVRAFNRRWDAARGRMLFALVIGAVTSRALDADGAQHFERVVTLADPTPQALVEALRPLARRDASP
jgi:uroporphyrinogen-III synthase